MPGGRTWREPFGALQIEADDGVLRPRPWTLLQSRWATDLLDDLPPGDVLELCTGAGHIGLAAVHGTGRRLVAVDAEPRACALARRNARQVDEEVDVREGHFDTVLERDERFVLVLADPPWVPTQRVEDHPEDPTWAIDGGIDGLEVARRCVRVAARHLVPGGRLLLQLGTRHQVDVIGHTCETSGVEVLEVREGGEDGSRGVVALLSLGRPQEGEAASRG